MKKALISILIVLLSASLCVFAVSCGGANGKDDSGASGDHGGTNTQEEGVDEGDIVKMYGSRIYKLQCDGLTINDVDKGDIKTVGFYSFSNTQIIPIEMYVCGKNVVLIAGKVNSFLGEDKYVNYYYQSYNTLTISVISLPDDYGNEAVDLKDNLEYTFDLIGGKFVTSRIVDGSGKLYFAFYTYNKTYSSDITGGSNVITVNYLEKTGESATYKNMTISRIPNSIEGYGEDQVTGFACVDINNLSKGATAKGYYGAYLKDIYMTENAIYPIFNCSIRNKDPESSGGCYSYGYYNYTKNSYVMKVDLNTMVAKYGVRLQDYDLDDRYALKEFGDTLYMVVTKRNKQNGYTTLIDNKIVSLNTNEMSLISKSETFAENEQIKSVTYEEADGKYYCYVTTFRQTDPLFKIDVTNPAQMTILGQLSIEGYSSHLQVVAENRMIGVGYDGTQTGARTDTVRVNLYDSSGASPVLLDYIVVSDVYACEALDEPRAICIFDDGAFAFSISRRKSVYSDGYYSSRSSYNMLLVFKVEGSNLRAVTYLSNFGDEGDDYGKTDSYSGLEAFRRRILRARCYDGYLYTISDGYITSYKVEDGFTISKQYVKMYSTDLFLSGGQGGSGSDSDSSTDTDSSTDSDIISDSDSEHGFGDL